MEAELAREQPFGDVFPYAKLPDRAKEPMIKIPPKPIAMTRNDYFKVKDVSQWSGCSSALLNPEALQEFRDFAEHHPRW